MGKTQKVISLFLKFGTLACTLGFVLSTLIQIYGRFFMEKAPSWSEEAARLFFVFAVGFSAGLAMKGNYYVHFDFLFNKLGVKWQQRLEKTVNILIIILFLVFSFYSVLFVFDGWQEMSPSLKFPMAIAFLGVAVLGFSITYYAILKTIKFFKSKEQ